MGPCELSCTNSDMDKWKFGFLQFSSSISWATSSLSFKLSNIHLQVAFSYDEQHLVTQLRAVENTIITIITPHLTSKSERRVR